MPLVAGLKLRLSVVSSSALPASLGRPHCCYHAVVSATTRLGAALALGLLASDGDSTEVPILVAIVTPPADCRTALTTRPGFQAPSP
jgi:hypothetical protein